MTRKELRASMSETARMNARHRAALETERAFLAEAEHRESTARAAHAEWIATVESIPEGSTLRDSEEAWGLWSFKQSTYYGGGLLPAADYAERIRNIRECMNT